MAVYINKPVIAPSYRGIPGGTFYTLRDEQNRVTTEFYESFPGRDNIYLGNLLVASYVSHGNSGTPGWNFHSSDHLGTVRLTVNGSTGTTIESQKYWPYGDKVGTPGAPIQKLAFASMERDPENNHYFDHHRKQDFNLGRYVSVDVLAGNAENPQTWNRYAYALGNPVRDFDPDGNASLDLMFRVAHADPQVIPIAQGLAPGSNPALQSAVAGVGVLGLAAPVAMVAPEGMAAAAAFNYVSGVVVGAANNPSEPLKGGAVGGALSAGLGVAGGPGLNILRAGVSSAGSQLIMNGTIDPVKVAATTTAAAAANAQVAVAAEMGAKPLVQSVVQRVNTALVSFFYKKPPAPPPPPPACRAGSTVCSSGQ